MLNNIPTALGRMTRNVVLNHPNTWECQVFRKQVCRQSDHDMGGLPTLGGLGVLDSEDETDIEFLFLGSGYALPAEAFNASPMFDRGDAVLTAQNEFRFIIEPEMPSGMIGHFDLRNHDVIYLVLHDRVKIAFEIVGVETVLNIAPFVTRYVCNRRGDLDFLGKVDDLDKDLEAADLPETDLPILGGLEDLPD